MINLDATVLAACDEAFGEPVEYRPGSGPPIKDIPGIFFDAFKSVRFDPATETMVSTTHPLLCCRASYFPRDLVQGELFLIRGRLYAIRVANADPVQVVTDLDALVDQAQIGLLCNPDFMRSRPEWPSNT